MSLIDWDEPRAVDWILGVGLVFFGGIALMALVEMLPERVRDGLSAVMPSAVWWESREARRRAGREAERALYRDVSLDPRAAEAIQNRDLAALRALVASGVEVNARGQHRWTPLMMVADCEWVEGAHVLLGAGADPRPRDERNRNAESLNPIYDEGQHPYGGEVTHVIRRHASEPGGWP